VARIVESISNPVAHTARMIRLSVAPFHVQILSFLTVGSWAADPNTDQTIHRFVGSIAARHRAPHQGAGWEQACTHSPQPTQVDAAHRIVHVNTIFGVARQLSR